MFNEFIEQDKKQAMWKLNEDKGKTLAYIEKLLEKREIKAGKWVFSDELGKTMEELKGESRVKEFNGTPENIMKLIKQEWDNKSGNELILFEQDIVFTLPKNEWPKF